MAQRIILKNQISQHSKNWPRHETEVWFLLCQLDRKGHTGSPPHPSHGPWTYCQLRTPGKRGAETAERPTVTGSRVLLRLPRPGPAGVHARGALSALCCFCRELLWRPFREGVPPAGQWLPGSSAPRWAPWDTSKRPVQSKLRSQGR